MGVPSQCPLDGYSISQAALVLEDPEIRKIQRFVAVFRSKFEIVHIGGFDPLTIV